MLSTFAYKLTCFAVATFLSTALCLPAMAAPSDLEALAQVNQTVITRKNLVWFTSHDQEGVIDPSYDKQVTLLDQLINRELLYQESMAKNISVSENEIKRKLDRLLNSLRTTHNSFKQKIGLSGDEIALEIEKDIRISKLLHKELPRVNDITEDEVRTYYQDHPENFLIDGAVRVRHILIKIYPKDDETARTQARKKIESILEQLRNGADFAESAKQYSDGPSRIKGGDVGWVHHGQKYKTFEITAYALKIGEISDIIETPLGYHILTVIEKKPTLRVAFEKAEKPLKKYLLFEKKQSLIKELLDHLKSAATIQIFVQQQ